MGRKGRWAAKQREKLTLLLQAEIKSRENAAEIQAKAATAPEHVKLTRSYGHGRYFCSGHAWTSYRACVTFDMRKQCVARVWRQYCRSCPHRGTVPKFNANEMKAIVVNAVDHFFSKDGSIKEKRGKPGDKPHERDLCELCRSGAYCG